MNINVTHSLLLIFIAAVVTFLIRLFPFVLFGGKRELSPRIKQIVDLLPPAIIAVLVIYCLKDSIITFGDTTIAALAGVLSTVLIHLWRRNTLLSIVVGTVVYMLLIRI